MNPNKYCKKCDAETARYDNNKCKPCCAVRDATYRREPKQVEVIRPGVHLEGSLHGQIRGGQGALRPSVRRGCTMSW